MTKALRSPGSTLKPFIYGLGFEDGLIHPETLIEDRPVRYGGYAPENFDLTFQGTVTVRKALQMSLNVPAVAVLDKVGAGRFAARLRQAGGALVLPKGEAPGLAMGLGGVGVRLSDLVMLYAGLARLGTTVPLTERLAAATSPAAGDSGAGCDRAAAADGSGRGLVCRQHPARARRRRTMPRRGRIAFKTGTSYGYRDAWAVGFDGKRTIGVWVGRPDGAPVPGLVGPHCRGADPVRCLRPLRQAAGAACRRAPRGTVVAANAKLPLPLQRFRPVGLPSDGAEPPLRIMFPPNGARLELAAGDHGPDPLAVKISGGAAPLTVLVNGIPLAGAGARRTVFFSPTGRASCGSP